MRTAGPVRHVSEYPLARLSRASGASPARDLLKMSTDWIDLCIHAEIDAGELLARLDDATVQGAWEEAGATHLYWPKDRWNEERVASVRSLLVCLDQSRGATIPLSIDHVPYRDWNRLWAESVRPLRVGRRLVICPSWTSAALQPGEIEVILDPKQAFGTGHHATTRMLLEWLEEDIRGGETILDVGTGSGLLAMAALRFGAARAMGIDHDPVAIECAQEYARQNRFGDGLSFDLVLANLDGRTLCELADRLTSWTGSKLLVSGLLTEQRDELMAALAAASLYPERQRKQEGWLAMEFLPAQACGGM